MTPVPLQRTQVVMITGRPFRGPFTQGIPVLTVDYLSITSIFVPSGVKQIVICCTHNVLAQGIKAMKIGMNRPVNFATILQRDVMLAKELLNKDGW